MAHTLRGQGRQAHGRGDLDCVHDMYGLAQKRIIVGPTYLVSRLIMERKWKRL